MKSTLVVTAIALSLVMSLRAQDATARHPITKDWITHHLVFSNPGTQEEAIKNGTLEHWLAIVNDPRYNMQQEERTFLANAPSGVASQAPTEDAGDDKDQPPEPPVLPYDGPLPRGLAKAVIAPSPDSAAPAKLPSHRRLKKDWSLPLTSGTPAAGAPGATTGLGEFPATYVSSSSSISCANDFAVYNTGLAGAGGQASIIAYNNIYATCNGGVPTVYWAFNTGGTIVNSVAFDAPSNGSNVIGTQLYFVQTNSSGAAQLVLLKWAAGGTNGTAINSPVAPSSVAASGFASCATPCMTTANLYSLGGTAATGSVTFITDPYTWPNHTGGGTGTSANVVIGGTTYTFPNPTSCTAATCVKTYDPGSVSQDEDDSAQDFWAAILNVSTDCSSDEGTPCFYVSGANASVTPTWSSSTAVVNLTAKTTGPGGNFTLTTNYSTGITVSGGSNGTGGSVTDTYSSPYYDPSSDTIYVGDDAGYLHKFTPVFVTPASFAEVTTGGWPSAVNTNGSLGSPVFYNTGTPSTSYVFVGDYPYNYASNCQPNVTTSNSPCGYLYSVNASSGAVTRSAQLDYNNGIIDSPILDASVGSVYVFVGQDNNGAPSAGTTTCNISGGPVVPCAGVYQFSVGFTSGSSGNGEAQVGVGAQFMLSGTFDNAYFNSSNETGNLYVVGNTGPANNTLFQIHINANALSTVTPGPQVATNYTNGYYAAGLQVTEYNQGTTDYIFLAALAFGNGTGCASQSLFVGCVMGFNVTSGTITTGQAVTGALPEEGGTSGIVVDYEPGYTGNIYFSTLLNTSCTMVGSPGPGCAIQTLQSAP